MGTRRRSIRAFPRIAQLTDDVDDVGSAEGCANCYDDGDVGQASIELVGRPEDRRSIPANLHNNPRNLSRDSYSRPISEVESNKPNNIIGYNVERWLGDHDDYLGYWLSYGGDKTLPSPSSLRTHSIDLELDLLMGICEKGTAQTVPLDIFDYCGHPQATDASEHAQELLELLHRTAALREELRQLRSHGNGPDALRIMAEKIDQLLLDYDRSASKQASPSSSRATNEDTQQIHKTLPAASTQVSSSTNISKQPDESVMQGEGSDVTIATLDSVRIGRTALRCFYHFGADRAGRTCDYATYRLRDLKYANIDDIQHELRANELLEPTGKLMGYITATNVQNTLATMMPRKHGRTTPITRIEYVLISSAAIRRTTSYTILVPMVAKTWHLAIRQ